MARLQDEVTPLIEEVQWKDIRHVFRDINIALADIIDDIEPTEAQSFIRVRYPFGAKIVENGTLCLPNQEGDFVPIHRFDGDGSLKSKLAYSAVPMGIILNKSCEIYSECYQRLVPLNMIAPGELFGLFETLSPPSIFSATPMWSAAAGARSVFMLPKITDSNLHKRLYRQYRVPALVPRKLSDHWRVFKNIAHNSRDGKNWYCEILFFTSAWHDRPKDSVPWIKFENYLYQQGWEQTSYHRDSSGLVFIWSALAQVIVDKRLKPNPYLIDTIKHLISILLGCLPGFRPADDSELVAPTELLQEAYIETYGLKDYLPIIMHPTVLRSKEPTSNYYSLMFPTLMESLHKNKSVVSTINELREIRFMLDLLIDRLSETDVPIPKQILDSTFQYFHSTVEPNDELLAINKIPDIDPAFIKLKDKYPDRVFPMSSSFARGCVRISTELL